MQDFQQLKLWSKAHQFVRAAYRETSRLPDPENCGLTSQNRRASSSISTNIAETSTDRSKP